MTITEATLFTITFMTRKGNTLTVTDVPASDVPHALAAAQAHPLVTACAIEMQDSVTTEHADSIDDAAAQLRRHFASNVH